MMQHWSDHLEELRDGATILTRAFGRRTNAWGYPPTSALRLL
jgi:hypothetical protein